MRWLCKLGRDCYSVKVIIAFSCCYSIMTDFDLKGVHTCPVIFFSEVVLEYSHGFAQYISNYTDADGSWTIRIRIVTHFPISALPGTSTQLTLSLSPGFSPANQIWIQKDASHILDHIVLERKSQGKLEIWGYWIALDQGIMQMMPVDINQINYTLWVTLILGPIL